jgi:hypothetical protein
MDGRTNPVIVLEFLGAWLLLAVATVAVYNAVKRWVV